MACFATCSRRSLISARSLCVTGDRLADQHLLMPAPKLQAVPEAYVPIIGANIAGVDFDFLFARVMAPTVPDDLDLSDDSILRGMDDANQRSLNGPSEPVPSLLSDPEG